MNQLIAMMGLPRSGKSTIARKLAAELGAPIVNCDAIRLALHGQRYQALAEPIVRALKVLMIRALFGAGHTVVICDETNYSSAAREAITSPEWETCYYHVPTSAEICKNRAVATDQPDLLPVIDRMQARYEPLLASDLRYYSLQESA